MTVCEVLEVTESRDLKAWAQAFMVQGGPGFDKRRKVNHKENLSSFWIILVKKFKKSEFAKLDSGLSDHCENIYAMYLTA